METYIPTEVEAVAALAATVCVCGKYKRSRMSHCRGCYWSLSPERRNELYRRIGNGYEGTFARSCAELNFTTEQCKRYFADHAGKMKDRVADKKQ